MANLKRYGPCLSKSGFATMQKVDNGGWVKFADTKDLRSSTDVQQLKLAIAALIPGIVTSFTLGDEKQFITLTNELRQLTSN